jgi:hypothetical protein
VKIKDAFERLQGVGEKVLGRLKGDPDLIHHVRYSLSLPLSFFRPKASLLNRTFYRVKPRRTARSNLFPSGIRAENL